MKTRQPVRIIVKIKTENRFGSGDLPAFFDMLRYDRATVVAWDRIENGFAVTLETTNFTPDRWASFGIYPEVKS